MLLAGLVCLNLALAGALLMSTVRLPSAYAQATGLAGNYMAVCGEVQNDYDALYLLDVRARALHAFAFDRGTKSLRYSDSRNLERDFRNN
jgi:hypothetical protein